MFRFAGEPTLTELLAEPIVQAMMHSDCVEPRDLRRLLRDARDGRFPTRRIDADA